jgi:hypothetical protein
VVVLFLPRMAEGDQEDGRLGVGQGGRARDVGRCEGADGDADEAERGDLEEDVLGDAAGLDVGVLLGAVAVLAGGAGVVGGDEDHGAVGADRALTQRGLGEGVAPVALNLQGERVRLRRVVPDAVGGEGVQLDGVEGAGRRGGAQAARLVRDALGGPEDLAEP